MKTKIFTLCGIFFVVTALILVNVVPAMANSPHTEGSSTHNSIQLVPPLSDPLRRIIIPLQLIIFLILIIQIMTRVELIGLKVHLLARLIIRNRQSYHLMDTTDHLWWGTNIGTNSNLFGVYAYQSIYNTISLYDEWRCHLCTHDAGTKWRSTRIGNCLY